METTVLERPVTAAGTAPVANRKPGDKPSFAEVRDTVTVSGRDCRDRVVSLRQLSLREGRLHVSEDASGDRESLSLTPWGAGQLCQRLGIPATYFHRCPNVLRDEQANFWLTKLANDEERCRTVDGKPAKESKWLLRMRGDRLRAVLTDRYAPLDNGTLVDCLTPLVGNRFQADWFAMDDESLHLRLFDPSIRREVVPGDPIMAGVHVSNSEVGKRAVTVDALVYRLVCSNGLISLVKGKSLMHRRHVGGERRNFARELEEAVASATEAASSMLERFAATSRQPVSDMEKTLEKIGVSWDLAESTRELVRAALLREVPAQQETVYGLINAVTSVAQGLPMDQRYHLELMAGRAIQNGFG